jgi:serine/threonine-protein kinase
MVLDHPYLKESRNNPFKLVLGLLLLGGGITIGAIALIISLLLSRAKYTPTAIPEIVTSSPPPTVTLPPLEPHQSGNLETYAGAIPIPESVPEEVVKPKPTPLEKPILPPPVATEDVPIFAINTEQKEVLATLGEPDSQQRGYWHNTVVWTYSNLVSGVEVKYTFDTKNEKLRQSEAIFNQGASLEVMTKTLNLLLGDEAPDPILSALTSVSDNETDLRSFSYQDKRGMIKRDTKENINIIVSASDFN